MIELVTYSLLSALCLSVLYLVYLIYQIRERRFGKLRFFLLAVMFLSLVLPLIHIDFDLNLLSYISSEEVEIPLNQTINTKTEVSLKPTGYVEDSEIMSAVDWKEIFTLVYLAGVLIFFFRLIFQLLGILRLSIKAEKRRESKYIILNSSAIKRAFSFFKFIFVPEWSETSSDTETILIHEKAHASQKHSLDILLAECISSLLWYNPLVWLMRKSLQTVHEYLADEAVLSEGRDKLGYQALLLNQVAEGQVFSLSSAFSYSLIKKRIIMMNSAKPTRRINPAGLLLLIVIPLLLVTVSCTDNTVNDLDDDIFTVVIDAGHGGTDPGAVLGDVTESELLLSFVKTLESSSPEGIKLVFTRNSDNYITLRDRVALCEKVEADLFISLHINIANPSVFSGIHCFTGREAPFNEESNQFCGIVLDHFQTLVGIKTVKRIMPGPFLVLNFNTTCPSIMLDLGNLSNSEDVEYISNMETQRILCGKLLDAIEEYKAL